MDIGMLWYDDDAKRPLSEKVRRAAAYYQDKYGQPPNICFVNPATLGGAEPNAGDVRLVANSTVIKNHFWLGVDPAEVVNV